MKPTLLLMTATYIFVILTFFIQKSFAEPTVIDIKSDIPPQNETSSWKFDCFGGYANLPSDFACFFSTVSFPPEDYHGEMGFWTQCGTRCAITYQVQPNDLSFGVRLYQRNLQAQIAYNEVVWRTVKGEGWTDFSVNLTEERYLNRLDLISTISLHVQYLSSDMYILIDKISVNNDNEGDVTVTSPGTELTTESSSSSRPVTLSSPTPVPTPTEITSITMMMTTTTTTIAPISGELVIDVESDIPDNGHWKVDCLSGYASNLEVLKNSSCSQIHLSPVAEYELSKKQGLWTSCGTTNEGSCVLSFENQRKNTIMVATFYEQNLKAEISLDNGTNWHEMGKGKGWSDISVQLNHPLVMLRMRNLGPDMFCLLDKVVLTWDDGRE